MSAVETVEAYLDTRLSRYPGLDPYTVHALGVTEQQEDETYQITLRVSDLRELVALAKLASPPAIADELERRGISLDQLLDELEPGPDSYLLRDSDGDYWAYNGSGWVLLRRLEAAPYELSIHRAAGTYEGDAEEQAARIIEKYGCLA